MGTHHLARNDLLAGRKEAWWASGHRYQTSYTSTIPKHKYQYF